MGQYYKPCVLSTDKQTVVKFMYSDDYDNGPKLMEHSYLGNDFVSAFETLIAHKPKRVVWAGDYADREAYEKVSDIKGSIVDFGKESNCYDRCIDSLKTKPKTKDMTGYDFIVNHDKKLYVMKSKCPKMKAEWADGMQIHSLPLLVSEGNGRGGGEYKGSSINLVGTWARDLISVEKQVPTGFTELIPNFDEK